MFRKLGILFGFVVLPAAAILFLASGEHVFSKLQYFGPKETIEQVVHGETVVDTAYFTIPDFRFTNQDGRLFTQDSVAGYNYVSNFFFTSCPTICPVMSTQLRRVQEACIDLDNFRILSHTIDPRRDSVPALAAYAEKYHAEPKVWQFLTADEDYLIEFANKSYLLYAAEDENAPGGFMHSEMVVLVDRDRHLRGVYDATNSEEIDRLVEELKVLMKEQFLEDRAREQAQDS